MSIRFIHTADLHLGKTYRNAGAAEIRSDDFFRMLDAIVADAIREDVDCLLIAGDLFHVGQILPRTFARTIASLQPLKEHGIPCIAVEGNHDWIHRRESISWMEALSRMGYICLLRPTRSDGDGGYRFDPFDPETGMGGRITVNDVTIYGLGYIGAQAGSHVPRICESIDTVNNILLFHVGIWSYSPVEIGNIRPEEAQPLADRFRYVALGHGHKPYVVSVPDGRPYAFNPGSAERVNFGEERYDKGYWLVTLDAEECRPEFRATSPRPMLSLAIDLDGASTVEDGLARFQQRVQEQLGILSDDVRRPLLELRLTGKVGFHPFELGRERLQLSLEPLCNPLHVEIRNYLSLVTRGGGEEGVVRSLAAIELEVLRELVATRSEYRGREDELVKLSLALRDAVLRGEPDGEELLGLLEGW